MIVFLNIIENGFGNLPSALINRNMKKLKIFICIFNCSQQTVFRLPAFSILTKIIKNICIYNIGTEHKRKPETSDIGSNRHRYRHAKTSHSSSKNFLLDPKKCWLVPLCFAVEGGDL